MHEVGANPSPLFETLPPKHLQEILDTIAQIPGGHAIVCLDAQFCYLYFNQNHKIGMKESWNADIEIGGSLLDYISIEEDKRLVKATLERMLAGEPIEETQSYGLSRAFYKSSYRLLRDEQENIVAIFILSTDITKRRQVEEALRASEERFRSTFEQSTSTILLLDQHLNIRQTNRAFTELTGYLPEEAGGRPLAALLGIGESAFDDFGQFSPLEEGRGWKNNLLIRAKSGRDIEVSLTIAGLFNSDHRLVEYIVTLRDITLRRKLEKAQQQFMYSISHEMRTPLTNLTLYTELLKKNPMKANYLNILGQQVERLQALVNGVLEITSLTLLKGTTSWSNYRLQGVLNVALKQNQRLAEQLGATIDITNISANLPVMTGDPVRLAQALSEIIKNGLNYASNGAAILITVQNEQINNHPWITIIINDNGPGIPFEELDYIFENFYRGQDVERRNIAGAGLGLPIAQAIIKAHGGRITVNSAPNQGSTFTVWLPSAQAIVSTASN